MAIQSMYYKISNSLDKHDLVMGIFIDLAKAFDTVDHNILLCKLEHYGIRGIAPKWFHDYLSRRKQYVVFNNATSNLMNINCGVPQGSILGPLLFILYVNDISRCSDVLFFILFADDTNIFFSCNNKCDLIKIVNEELLKLSNWFRANTLSLNVRKTNYILFGNKSKLCYDHNFHITIEGHLLERVTFTKFLGVYIDEDLNWKHHITHIALKISQNIGVLNRVKSVLPSSVLLSLYYTMVQPYLMYCNIIWGGANLSNLKILVNLQKRAVRVITNSCFRAHSSPLFARLGLLKILDMYKLQILMFMYKSKHSMLPASCYDLVSLITTVNRYDFRTVNDFVTIKFRTDIRKRCISVIGPDSWNSLSEDVKNIKSISIFKKTLSKLYIECY
jgi:hypothetical protein